MQKDMHINIEDVKNWQYKAVIYPPNINTLFFVMDMQWVFCETETEKLSNVQIIMKYPKVKISHLLLREFNHIFSRTFWWMTEADQHFGVFFRSETLQNN